MAKAGSHLLIQILRGVCQVGPFCIARVPHVHRQGETRFTPLRVLANLDRLNPGDIAFSKIPARPEYIEAVTKPGRAAIYLYRDPRDVIVSHIFYVTEINRSHPFTEYVTRNFDSLESRIDLFIRGNRGQAGPGIPGILDAYRSYQGWLESASIFQVRYEDLMLRRSETIVKMLEYLERRGSPIALPMTEAVKCVEQAIAPHRSTTFRRGEPGNWRKHFSENNKRIFKELAGSLLLDLGYEQDAGW